MIISCPHCSSRYKVKDDLITTSGKKLRCKKCSAVFTAFPDKDAVLMKLPDGSAPPKAQTSKPNPLGGPTAGATIQVDRSQIDAFLKQQAGDPTPRPTAPKPPAGPSLDAGGTVQVDRSQIDAFLKESKEAGGPPKPPPAKANMDMAGTVQVDRSQIDAFLKQAENEKQSEPPPPPPNDMAGTVQVDRAQIDAFLKQGPDAAPPEPPPVDMAGTVQVDRAQIDAFLKQGPEGGGDDTVDHPENATQGADDTAKIAADDQDDDLDFNLSGGSGEPAFPSDEELGLTQKDDVDLLAPTAEIPVADPNYKRTSKAAETVASTSAPSPQSTADVSHMGDTLYKAKVDGETYPDLTLKSLQRWVTEGRLLGTDLVSEQYADNYRPAAQIAEIAPFFKGQTGVPPASPTNAPAKPEKKGFIAWLKGLFKKG